MLLLLLLLLCILSVMTITVVWDTIITFYYDWWLILHKSGREPANVIILDINPKMKVVLVLQFSTFSYRTFHVLVYPCDSWFSNKTQFNCTFSAFFCHSLSSLQFHRQYIFTQKQNYVARCTIILRPYVWMYSKTNAAYVNDGRTLWTHKTNAVFWIIVTLLLIPCQALHLCFALLASRTNGHHHRASRLLCVLSAPHTHSLAEKSSNNGAQSMSR